MPARNALEQADREEDFSAWLAAHGIEDGSAAELVDTHVELATLDHLAQLMSEAQLEVGLRWLGAVSSARLLSAEIDQAVARIHDLVSAVKRFTYMDRAAAQGRVSVTQGIQDAVTAHPGQTEFCVTLPHAPD